jgi:hypothetical protein
MRRVARKSLIVACAIAVVAPLLCAAAAFASTAGHVWVYGSTGGPYVSRYPVTNGVPGHSDLFYPQPLSAAITVDSAGRLYAIDGFASIEIFHPGSATPERELGITFINSYINVFQALVVDAHRNVFIAFSQLSSAKLRGTLPSDRCQSITMLVYSLAGAQPRLTQCYAPTFGFLTMAGMGLDAAGNLYMPNGDQVDVYANPASNPAVIRTLRGPTFVGANAAAVDAQGTLFVADAGTSGSYVSSYLAAANGVVQPLTKLLPPAGVQFSGSIAVDDRYLYVGAAAGSLDRTYIYQKSANGRATPTGSIRIPGQASLPSPYFAIGP